MRTGFLFAILLVFSFGCSKNKTERRADNPTCYTGKLVKLGPCGQVVIEIISENKAGLEYAAEWIDPASRKVHRNVFYVHNACDLAGKLPDSEVFTFSINDHPSSDCIMCQAYTALPAEKNNITIGCNQTGGSSR